MKFFKLIRHAAVLATLVLSATFAPAQTSIDLCTEESLRTALGAGGIVQLNCGTNLVTLTRPIVITTDTTLTATQEVVISGAGATRLFVVNPGVKFTMNGIALFSGKVTETNANTGGIPDTAGAAIYNDGGSLVITKSRFEGHSVTGLAGLAGGNANSGNGDDGEAGGDAAGAGIFNNGGSVTISNSTFVANSVTAGAGGNGGNGGSGLGGNGGNGGNGGSAGGAAVYSQGGTVGLFHCTFTNNLATGAIGGAAGAGSGILGFNGAPGEAGDAVGAAVAGADAKITIYGCTFAGNKSKAADGNNNINQNRKKPGENGMNGGDAAGGAVYSTGSLNITNSTFFQNSSTSGKGGNGGNGGADSFGYNGGNGGNGGTASGGAVEMAAGGSVIHCTFSDNSVVAGAGGTGGAGSGPIGKSGVAGSTGALLGAALYSSPVVANVANNIFANSPTATLAGNISDKGGNLATDQNAGLTSSQSFRGVNPLLRALANNGGPTLTMAIPTNSPAATNLSAAAFCVPFDQRGSNRLAGCDIGAYEIQIPPAVVPSNLKLNSTTRTNELVLIWPTNVSNIFLEHSTNVSATNWVAVTNLARVSAANYVLNVPVTNFQRTFYRLASTNAVPSGTTNQLPPFPTPGTPNTDEENDPGTPEFPTLPPIPGQ